MEDCIGEFNENFEKINILKDKTENEMTKLNELYIKIDKDLTNSFEEKHLNLTKKENEIREELQNEVTKIKEKLENYLTNINELIRSSEKINKGIKAFEKEEKQMIKLLAYVSKINRNKKEMSLLIKEQMKNLNIDFIKEENIIKYTEYFFNGFLYNIKNIEFKDISFDKFKLSWNIEAKNKLNDNNNKITYKVETRKEKNNEQFKLACEGKETNCSVNKLEFDTSYEIRISIIYENILGNYSVIKKVKTKELDSIILKESKRGNELWTKIHEFLDIKKIELIYRGTRDGMNSRSFHNKCDNKGPTICLYKNDKGHIFGAYAGIAWTDSGEWKSATHSFLFTLTNIHNTLPIKLPHNLKDNIYSVYHHSEFGPSFGSGRDLSIAKDFSLGESYANFPYTYVDSTGKGSSIFSSDLNRNKFTLKEIEVFKVN